MVEALKFLFELRDVDEIVPWGGPENPNLSWFGLTDGFYCIETPDGRLFETVGTNGRTSWCDYQVSRLFEDIIGLWPFLSEPVPADFAKEYLASAEGLSWPISPDATRQLLSAEGPQNFIGDADSFYELVELAEWWRLRRLDTLYLAMSPEVHLWRVDERVHLWWQAPGPEASSWRFVLGEAFQTYDYSTVQNAVKQFVAQFLEAMGARVRSIELNGWRRTDCRLDVMRLVEEQREREDSAKSMLARMARTDWDAMRLQLRRLTAVLESDGSCA